MKKYKKTTTGEKQNHKTQKRTFLRRVLRALLIGIMFLFLAGCILWLVMLRMFNAQQIGEAVTYQLQRVFNRPVVISAVDLKFFNTLELKGFAVLDNEVQPGEPVLSAESVLIRYRLFPLLFRELIVDEVTLNKPRIDVVRSEKGLHNVPPINTVSEQTTYVSKTTGRKMQIKIEDWRVKDGVISYKDLKSGVSHAVYGLQVRFKKLRFNQWSSFRLETVLRNRWGKRISDLEIRGQGQINFANFNWSNFALRNFRTQVAVFRKPVDVTVELHNLRKPQFSFQAQVPAFDQQDLSVFEKNLPAFQMPASSVKAKGRFDTAESIFQLDNVSLTNRFIKLTSSGKIDFSKRPLQASARVKSNGINLAILHKYLPAIERFSLTGQGAMQATLERAKGQFSLPSLELETKNAGGNFWGFGVSGLNGQLLAKQNFEDLYMQTTSGRVQVAETVFAKLQMDGSYRQGNVYGYIASALLNDVPLKMRLSINHIKSKNRQIDTSIYLQHFEPMGFIGVVQDFVEVILAIPKHPAPPTPLQTGDLAWMRNFRDRLPTFMPNFSGTLYADTFASTVLSGKRFNAEFDLKGMLPGAAELEGTLDAKLEEGVIHQMEKLAEEQEALNVTFTPFIMMHRMERSGSFKVGEVLKDVAFHEMAGSVDFKKGTMVINNAFTQGPVMSAAVSGWTDWVREMFSLEIWTMFTPSSSRGILAENLTDESGNPALAFKVSSSMLKPKVEMLRAKKTNAQIMQAQKRGLRTDFAKSKAFVQGEFNAKK